MFEETSRLVDVFIELGGVDKGAPHGGEPLLRRDFPAPHHHGWRPSPPPRPFHHHPTACSWRRRRRRLAAGLHRVKP